MELAPTALAHRCRICSLVRTLSVLAFVLSQSHLWLSIRAVALTLHPPLHDARVDLLDAAMVSFTRAQSPFTTFALRCPSLDLCSAPFTTERKIVNVLAYLDEFDDIVIKHGKFREVTDACVECLIRNPAAALSEKSRREKETIRRVYVQGSDVQIRTSDHLLGLDLRGWP
ncbi:hypothetical protein B0H13DRAFT_2045552 [Mycena leptocephala]|nr:hypothetical protein B0H13DRAFT_2045552 [Mycena leptocephala]